jgi:hypothetical protein
MEQISSWDFIRSVLVDADLDAHEVKRIYEGMIEQTDAFTRELIEMTDEELKGRVAELMGLCYELSQPQLVPVVRWLFKNTMTFKDVDNLYMDFIFSNNIIPEDVLTFIVRSDPELSVSECLVTLIKSNVYGSRQYAFERIHPYVDSSNVSRGALTTCIELARELGDEEAMGFMKQVYISRYAGLVERMAVVGRVSREYYQRLLADECQAMAIYRSKLQNLLELGNVPIKAMNRARQLEVKSLLEKVSGMKELDEGAFDELCQEGLMGLRQVKFIELLNWIETNPVFRKLYGPYNPDRVIRQSVFGRANSQLPEFPTDPRRYYMLYRDMESEESDWYTGFCDHCIREIPVRQRAFRVPIAEGGGWEGCFCSASCSVKHLLSGPAYNIPLEDLDERMDFLERQLKAFLAGEGFGFYEGLGFLVREFPVLLTSQEGDSEDRRGMRLPKIVVVPAREEKIAQSYSEDEQYRQIIDSGQDLLRQLGIDPDDYGLLKDEGETIRYVKEIVLKRDHLETYALTMLMNRIYEAEHIVVPPM